MTRNKLIGFRQSSAGFTIVEVIVALAIASLIFSLIFGVVPALLRNSRNGDRKQDVATVLDAVSRYQLRHSGNFPGVPGGSGAAGYDDLTNLISGVKALKLKQYDASSGAVSINFQTVSDPDPVLTSSDKIEVYNFNVCSGSNASGKGAGYRSIVALYALENANGPATSQCQQL